ncbi:MAG: radical SAM protein, partial [Planctomycetes bacterium]|nr:radical SAM protein [Planctomycetota bacterium]
ICSYDCIYCHCGRTVKKTIQRKEYIPVNKIVKEVKSFLGSYEGKLDYLTLSGAGEPTLNSGLGKIIHQLKKICKTPVAVITNSSLLWRPDVREEISRADLVLPSLDAAKPNVFRLVNRPNEIKLSEVIDGLIEFRRCFKGEIWLEIFLCRTYNDGTENLKALKKAVKEIRPDKIHLNTVTRPPAEYFAYSLIIKKMRKIARAFGRNAEIIMEQRLVIPQKLPGANSKDRILSLLKRRPCQASEIAGALGIDESKLTKYISGLENKKKIKYAVTNDQIYYYLGKR